MQSQKDNSVFFISMAVTAATVLWGIISPASFDAAAKGLRRGDVILSANNQPTHPGDHITVNHLIRFTEGIENCGAFGSDLQVKFSSTLIYICT